MAVEIKGVWDDDTSQTPLYVSRETFCHETTTRMTLSLWLLCMLLCFIIYFHN
jgi:uncharacterized membrane protein YozB (DUF420 family)